MKSSNRIFALTFASAMALGAYGASAQQVDHSKMDHSKMDHSQAPAAAKEAGVKDFGDLTPGPGMGHMDMTDAEMKELREKVDVYKDLSDAEIHQSMHNMPGDHAYVFETQIKGDTGVLVLAHGAGGKGDEILINGVRPMSQKYPTAIAFGMAMTTSDHFQQAVDRLEKAGAKKIIVVPTVISGDSSVYQQWEYILGREKLSAYVSVPRLKTGAKIVVSKAMTDHPLLSEILKDHALEMSVDPAKEMLIIVGHGSNEAEQSAIEEEALGVHVARIKAATKFADVRAKNLQDDAAPAVREANVAKVRSWIEDAHKKGLTPIVVGDLVSTRGIQHKIPVDLKNLEYKFQTKGVSQHKNFIAWIAAATEEAAAAIPRQPEC